MVVNKPAGISVHPARGSGPDTLVVQVRRIFSSRGIHWRHVAPVSRLDRGTSGLVLLATDHAAHPGLHRQVIARQIHREYRCLVWGRPLFEETSVELPLGRRWDDAKRMAVYDLPSAKAASWGARPAQTRLWVAGRSSNAALLRARLQTGRMHQIRVHCHYLRLPLIGDPWYGPSEPGWPQQAPERARALISALRWQCLHAGLLRFQHPLTGRELEFCAPDPPQFQEVQQLLGVSSSV